MYAQLDLEVISKKSPRKRRPSNFYEVWSKEVHYKNNPKKQL
jgi:hypothetical protein